MPGPTKIRGFEASKCIVPFLSQTGTSLWRGNDLRNPEHTPVIFLPNLVRNSVTAIVRSTDFDG